MEVAMAKKGTIRVPLVERIIVTLLVVLANAIWHKRASLKILPKPNNFHAYCFEVDKVGIAKWMSVPRICAERERQRLMCPTSTIHIACICLYTGNERGIRHPMTSCSQCQHQGWLQNRRGITVTTYGPGGAGHVADTPG